MAVLERFAQSLGLELRAQPYGDTIGVAQIATTVDVPETEGRATGLRVPALERLQDYRVMSTSAHMAGSRIYSTACCAILDGAYGQTWKDVLSRFDVGFVGGINQVVLHRAPGPR